ncbi:esterase/lipase family protein [Enterobacteriaceae bacterium LUAb1]
MKDTDHIIKIYPTYDEAGNAHYDLCSQPKGSALIQQCVVYPERVIPIVFIPGVMGSNLKSNSEDSEKVWNLDSVAGIFIDWFSAGADTRKKKLDPSKTEVDDSGKVDEKAETFLLKTRQQRGWGSVAYTSYAPFLSWLQDELNDFEASAQGERGKLLTSTQAMDAGELSLQQAEIDLTYRYIYPVFAIGYNWLQSNADSASALATKIDKEIIQFYQGKGRKCEKVILITHSMGGLVARHYTQNLKGETKVLGVVHGVMPALGAAATYRRMKAGTEYQQWSLEGWVASQVLGGNAKAMTAVLSQSPGPLQLLPGRDYGMQWLKLLDGKTVYYYPKEDPYDEIYLQRDKWWGLCEEQFINPGNRMTQKERDQNWADFANIIDKKVMLFIEGLSGKYHANTYAFYSAEQAFLSYGDIIWQSKTSVIDQWINQGRSRRPEEGRALNKTEKSTCRSVSTPLNGKGWAQGIYQTWTLQPPQEAGDGTVPQRSGRIAGHYLQARYPVAVQHEPAYQNAQAQQFTLRALVKIIQAVKQTTLAYV